MYAGFSPTFRDAFEPALRDMGVGGVGSWPGHLSRRWNILTMAVAPRNSGGQQPDIVDDDRRP